MMKIKDLIKKGTLDLRSNGIDNASLKARLLMQHSINKNREYLIVHDEDELTKAQIIEFKKGIEQLIYGVPLQYITHLQEFMKMDFYVDESVLIPRPDTEILVEEVINISKGMKDIKILDMCTGSGAIAISLAKYIEDCQIIAVDVSKEALRVAKLNAKNQAVESKISFINSNLFYSIVKERYDIIVSNPPYIRKDVIKSLSKEVQNEPKLALDGGLDGLDFYRKIINSSSNYLKVNGYLCLEIGFDQKSQVIDLIKDKGDFSKVYSIEDLAGKDRVIVAKI